MITRIGKVPTPSSAWDVARRVYALAIACPYWLQSSSFSLTPVSAASLVITGCGDLRYCRQFKKAGNYTWTGRLNIPFPCPPDARLQSASPEGVGGIHWFPGRTVAMLNLSVFLLSTALFPSNLWFWFRLIFGDLSHILP
jgi:hypothetical protein